MKKIDIGQGVQILANLGVIAGIIFLGVEISQNNALMEAEARYNRLVTQTGSQTIIAENSQLAEILAKNLAGTDLSAAEQIQFNALYGRAIANIAWAFGELPTSELPVSAYRRVLNGPGVHSVWEDEKDSFDPEFVRFIEEQLLVN